MGTAKPEVGDLPAGRRIDQARRLRRDQRRDADGPQQPRFQQQRLAEGRGHAQQGLVGEGDGPFGHGQDLAGEPEAAQLVEERRVVGFDPGQVGEILLRVSEITDEGQRRLEPRGQEIRSPEWRRTGVEVERRRRVLPRPPAHVRGVEVVEIDEETGGRLGFGPHRLHVPRALSGPAATPRRSPARSVCRPAPHSTGTSWPLIVADELSILVHVHVFTQLLDGAVRSLGDAGSRVGRREPKAAALPLSDSPRSRNRGSSARRSG